MQASLAHWDAYEWEFRLRSGEPSPLDQVILPEFEAGSIGGTVLAVGGDSREHCLGHDDPLLGALGMCDAVLRDLEGCDRAVVVQSRADLQLALASDRVWFVLGLEGCRPLRGDLSVLRMFYRLGVRCVGLTWNGRNEAADGVGVPSPGGLTEFGRDLVAELNRLGVLIDVSHLSAPGLADVLERSTAPVCASHSNARALVEHRRNLSDEQVRAIGAKGGMVGVNFIPMFLSVGAATIDDISCHVLHLASLIGPDCVMVGPDWTYEPWRASFSGQRSYQGLAVTITRYPIHRPSEMPMLAEALARAGLSDAEVEGVMGNNLVRLLNMVLPTGGRSLVGEDSIQ